MIYSFECEKCEGKFEKCVSMDKIVGYRAKCPYCKSSKTFRDYEADNVQFAPPQRTLGSLADKNKMSIEAQRKIVENRGNGQQPKQELPEGVSRYEKDETGKYKPTDS